MDDILTAIAILLVVALNALFFCLGFITGGNRQLRPYVLAAMVLMVLGGAALLAVKGPAEAIALTAFVSWMAGVGVGELRAWYWSGRGGRR